MAIDLAPRRLITTLYGLYARERGNWLSVAGLVRLMDELGVDATSVRSSVSRLKRRGVLVSDRREGRAGYALSPEAVEVLREGDRRIWFRPRARPEDGWLVVVFSVPEAERDKRHILRSTLRQLGFGTAAPGVWVAPATSYEETASALDRSRLTGYTAFFGGDYLGEDVSERVAQWWDLVEIERLYAEFLRAFTPLRRTDPSPGRAFAGYVPMLTAWRRMPYLDPGIPLEHLPSRWQGDAAAGLFSELDAALRKPAERHARGLLRS